MRRASNAVSSHTQGNIEKRAKTIGITKIRVPKCLDSFTKIPPSEIMKRNSLPCWYRLKEILYGHPLAGLLWKSQVEEVFVEGGWRKVPNWDAKRSFFVLSVYEGDIQIKGKKNNLTPMWDMLMKEADLGEATSLPDQESFVGLYTARLQSELENLRKKTKTCSNQ